MRPSDARCLHLLRLFHVLLLLAEIDNVVRLITISFGPLAILIR